jgi:hypothetical protein
MRMSILMSILKLEKMDSLMAKYEEILESLLGKGQIDLEMGNYSIIFCSNNPCRPYSKLKSTAILKVFKAGRFRISLTPVLAVICFRI